MSSNNVNLEYIFAGLLLLALIGLVISGYGTDPTVGEIRGLLGIAVGVLYGRGLGRDAIQRASSDITANVKELTGPLRESDVPNGNGK